MANGDQPKVPKTKGSANFKNRPSSPFPIVPTPLQKAPVKGRKPTRGEITESYRDVKEFFSGYVGSPKYLERLRAQGYIDPESVVEERRRRINSGNLTITNGTGSEYKRGKGIIIDPTETAEYNMTASGAVAHEMSHQVGSFASTLNPDPKYEALNSNEVNFINKRNLSFPAWPEHDARAWEAKADIDALRYILGRDKIYDAGRQEFTPEHLKKVKEKYKNADFKRLFNNFSDKDLINIMNSIAYQPNNSQTAKYGEHIMKKGNKLSNKIDFSPMYEVIPEAKSGASVKYSPKYTKKKAQNGLVADPTDPYGSYSGIDFKPSMPKTVNIPGTPPSYVPQVAFGELGRRMDEQLAPDNTFRPRRGFTQADVLGPLSLISSIIPEGDVSRKYVRPEDLPTNQQYTYGIGSQAIFRGGGHMTDNNPTGYMPYIPAWDEDTYVGMQANYGGDYPVPAEMLAEYLDIDMNEDMYGVPIAEKGWIQKAINPKHKGYCTPMTKSTCTPRRKALARRFKSGDLSHEEGGTVPSYDQGGGLSRAKDYGSKKKPYPSVNSSDFAGGGRSYPIPTRADAVDALRLAGLHGREDIKRKVYAKYPDLKKADHGGIIPDPSYPFYPTEYKEAKYEKGGSVSPEKAKKILKDGTIRGKKLTDKQRRFFGAMSSAAEGFYTEDPDPKKQRAKVKAAGEKLGQFENAGIDRNRSYYQGNNIDRTARYADVVNQLIAEGIDPFSQQGSHARNYGTSEYGPAFYRDMGVQIKSFQADPTYNNLTAEQRLENFYRRSNPNPEVQKYLTQARSLAGSPTAFYQGRAMGRMEYGGQLTPYFEEGTEYDLSPFTIKRLLAQGYILE